MLVAFGVDKMDNPEWRTGTTGRGSWETDLGSPSGRTPYPTLEPDGDGRRCLGSSKHLLPGVFPGRVSPATCVSFWKNTDRSLPCLLGLTDGLGSCPHDGVSRSWEKRW